MTPRAGSTVPNWKLRSPLFTTIRSTSPPSLRSAWKDRCKRNKPSARPPPWTYRFTYRRVQGQRHQTSALRRFHCFRSRCEWVSPTSATSAISATTIWRRTKGSYTTIDAGVASSYFGSETDFSSILVQNSTYHAFGKNRPTEKKFVFARSLRIGVESSFGNTVILPPGQACPDPAQTTCSVDFHHSAGRAVSLGRRKLASRIRLESGRSPRSDHWVSRGRQRAFPEQPGNAFSTGDAAFRPGQRQLRPFPGRGQRLYRRPAHAGQPAALETERSPTVLATKHRQSVRL